MEDNARNRRLAALGAIPPIARKDHRNFLNKNGEPPWLSNLSRKERRKLDAESKKLSRQYVKIQMQLDSSGAGFPADKLLRQMAIEYTHRYASSGVENQPVSFNYFEPFCDIKFFDGTIAPYVDVTEEFDHLFNITDFFDYLTTPDSNKFELSSLSDLPNGKSLHFTTNGDVQDLKFLNAEGSEFVISGFTIVRRENSLHWYLVGGNILSDEEWLLRSSNQQTIDPKHFSPSKRKFLSESIRENGNKVGAPLPLEGTERAVRTVVAGELDLKTNKHLGRCVMSETENSFGVICDDPEVLHGITDEKKRKEVLKSMMDAIDKSSALWDLAEALLQLPAYFAHKVKIEKTVLVSSGKRQLQQKKGGRGIDARYKRVSAIDIVSDQKPLIQRISPPHYETETEGHWRRLKSGSMGRDRDGNPIPNKTWIKSQNKWRERKPGPRIIYVKNSIAQAKLTVAEYQKASESLKKTQANSKTGVAENFGELYVLRCSAMADEIYKVGWTSGEAEHRAAQLSTATGVASAFVVAASWKHADAEALETEVHIMLEPYRINDGREFFKVGFGTIKKMIENAIQRTSNRQEAH